MIPAPRSGVAGAPSPTASAFRTSSFTEYLRDHAPEVLPGNRAGAVLTGATPGQHGAGRDHSGLAPHGTTIVAMTYADGVLLAGDRRATMGNLIAQRDIEKVFVTDDHSAVGIAGTAGIAIELVRLFAVELEHYEKIEGLPLSLDGKANRLATMVRGNLGAAMQGLAVVPLFVGYDLDVEDPAAAGRIVSYDVTGGRYEEHAGFHSVGSGSLFARSALKKRFEAGSDEPTALRTVVEALYDAADDDSATGGPDLVRGLYPTVVEVTAEGAVVVGQDRCAEVAAAVVADRHDRPGG